MSDEEGMHVLPPPRMAYTASDHVISDGPFAGESFSKADWFADEAKQIADYMQRLSGVGAKMDERWPGHKRRVKRARREYEQALYQEAYALGLTSVWPMLLVRLLMPLLWEAIQRLARRWSDG